MNALRILVSFVRRDWAIARSYRMAFVLDLVRQLFQVTIFFYLSRLVDPAALPSADTASVDYFSFVLVGLVFLNFATIATTSFSSNVQLEQATGSLEALLTTPTPASLVILGSSAYAFIRSTISTIVLLGLAIVLFGLRPDPSALSIAAALAALVVSIGLFVALGVAVAAFTIVFKRGQAAINLVTSALGLLSGVFFPVALFPRPLQIFAEALPFTWGLTLVRDALLEGRLQPVRLLLLSATASLALWGSIFLLEAALRHARRAGSLAQY